MSSPASAPDGMMRTKRGTRMASRPAATGEEVVFVVFGIEIRLTLEESRELRHMLKASEQRSRHGEAFDDI